MAYPQESDTLRRMLRSGARISWEVPHARQQAKTRDVPVFVAERIIRGCSVRRIEIDPDGSDRWRLSGRDPDGRPVDVVVKPVEDHTIRVITVIRTD